MGYHIRMEELHNISNGIISQTDEWMEQLSRIRTSLMDLFKTYRSSLILYVDGYRDIEPDLKGEIPQDVLEEQLEQLQREKFDFQRNVENIEQIFRELSQYMDVDGFSAAGVLECYDNAMQHVDKVRNQVGEYEEQHRHDMDSIDEMLKYIEHFLNLHGAGTNGSFYQNGTSDASFYEPGSIMRLPEYQKAENLNALQRMYVEQVSGRVRAGMGHLSAVNAGAELHPKVCVLPIHGVVAAARCGIPEAAHGAAAVPGWGGKISDTIFLAAQHALTGVDVEDGWNAGVFAELQQLQENAETYAREYEINHSVYGIVGDMKSGALTKAQQQVNAEYIYDRLSQEGWSREAICGLFGNIENESTFNPGIWQDLNAKDGKDTGYGIVQITPATHFVNWINGRPSNSKIDDMQQLGNEINVLDAMAEDNPKGLLDKELEFMIDSCQINDDTRRWIPTTDYGSTCEMTYEEYISSNLSPEELAIIFHASFERSDDTEEMRQEREKAARRWYDHFNSTE